MTRTIGLGLLTDTTITQPNYLPTTDATTHIAVVEQREREKKERD
jgi:hypothetical protein